MLFEEFLAKYEEHIEGKAVNDRTMRESNFGDEVKSSRSKSGKSKGKTLTGDKSGRDDESINRSQIASRASLRESTHIEEINKKFEEERMTLPENCYVYFSKSVRVEKLESKYQLLSHPYPSV